MLLEEMLRIGVREGLVRRLEEIYKETKSRVKVEGETGENIWTARGVRQGCPLSPLLFNIMIANVEEELKKGGWGGVRLGEVKIYSLAYADDMVLLAESEEGMTHMLGKLESYLDGKRLEINVEKTKVMRFRKEGGRLKKAN